MACRKLGACNTLLASVGAGLMQTDGETVSSTSLPQPSDPQGGPRAPLDMQEACCDFSKCELAPLYTQEVSISFSSMVAH